MVGSRLEKVLVVSDIDYKDLYLQDPNATIDWRNLNLPDPGTMIVPHEETTRRLSLNREDNAEYAKDYACAIVGERLFSTAITCLSASGIAISRLSTELYMLGNVQCAGIPGWHQLDLSKLKHLELTLVCPDIPYALTKKTAMAAFLGDRQNHIQVKLGDMAHDLLDKCHSTVEIFNPHLSFLIGWAMVWPTRVASYDLPALQKFCQGGGCHPRLLHDWLLKMKNLRSLHIWGKPAGRYALEWRHVFDAIRDHPNLSGPDPKGIRFEFPFEIFYDGVVCRDSTIATPREQPDTKPHALEAHLYGEIEFSDNKVLIEQLGDEAEDDGWETESE